VGGLKYARRSPGLGWSVNTTPDDTDPDGIYTVIAQPALAFDLAEEPHLSYAGNNQANDYRVSPGRVVGVSTFPPAAQHPGVRTSKHG